MDLSSSFLYPLFMIPIYTFYFSTNASKSTASAQTSLFLDESINT